MRRLLPLTGVVIALMIGAQTARATTPGLTATLYQIDAIPPARVTTWPQCGTTTLPNINLVWEYQPIEGCPLDEFMAHLTGYLTFPEHQTARLWVAGDDGVLMKVGLDEFGAWQDQGCSAYESEPVTYPAGVPIPVDLWYYENGGGTCLMAAWSLDGGPWEIIPPEAFSTAPQEPTPPATTTTSTSTTTVPPTTTSTTSTVPASTSTYQDSSTTTTTSQTVQTAPITTQPSTTYQPATSSSAPSDTAPTPTSIQNPVTTSTTPPTTILDTPAIPSTIPATIPTTSTPATVPPEDLTPREALTVALDPAKVAALTAGDAEQVFAAIDEDELTPELGAALVAAVQNAPTAVRAAFEQNVNVFAGNTDQYVPLGSTVPVRTRRVIIITTGLVVAMPTRTRARP